LPQLRSVLFLSHERLTLQNSLGLSICDFKGLRWPTANPENSSVPSLAQHQLPFREDASKQGKAATGTEQHSSRRPPVQGRSSAPRSTAGNLQFPHCFLQHQASVASKGRIWSQSNKVSATKGTSVTLSACQRINVGCPPQDVQPCVCCHAGILGRSDARLSNTSSPPWGRGRTSREGRRQRESVC